MKTVLSLTTKLVRVTETVKPLPEDPERKHYQWYEKEIPQGTTLIRTERITRHEETYPAKISVEQSISFASLDNMGEFNPSTWDSSEIQQRHLDLEAICEDDKSYTAVMFQAGCDADKILKHLFNEGIIGASGIMNVARKIQAIEYQEEVAKNQKEREKPDPEFTEPQADLNLGIACSDAKSKPEKEEDAE